MRTGRSLTGGGGGVSARGEGEKRVSAPRGVSAPGGCLLLDGCLLPGGGGVPCFRGGVSQHALRQTPPVNRITDTSKNITLITTSLRPIIMLILYSIGVKIMAPGLCSVSNDTCIFQFSPVAPGS